MDRRGLDLLINLVGEDTGDHLRQVLVELESFHVSTRQADFAAAGRSRPKMSPIAESVTKGAKPSDKSR